MASKVFFSSLKQKENKNQLDKIQQLLQLCNIQSIFSKDELIAIKIHFGEFGNAAFVRPVFLRPVVDLIKHIGAKAFLVDTNTLYIGMRTNSVDHLHNANLNGFGYSTLQTPIVIADGLRGENSVAVKIDKGSTADVQLAADILNADGMVCISHFKGHEVTGMGGAIKNLSMGCASRKGKLDMHSGTKPVVKEELCIECGKCVDVCQTHAIEIKESAYITDRCVGCARCIGICPKNAIKVNWSRAGKDVQHRMVEYAYGVDKALNSNILYVNFLTSISPDCDCCPGNDAPVVPDIGYLASTDPVAIDAASYELVQQAAGNDPFKKAHPDLDSSIQLNYAQEIGFGDIEYELVEL